VPSWSLVQGLACPEVNKRKDTPEKTAPEFLLDHFGKAPVFLVNTYPRSLAEFFPRSDIGLIPFDAKTAHNLLHKIQSVTSNFSCLLRLMTGLLHFFNPIHSNPAVQKALKVILRNLAFPALAPKSQNFQIRHGLTSQGKIAETLLVISRKLFE